MTYQEILDLIELNLESGTEIPAIKHRAVETALLDYINDNLPKQYDIKYIYADTTYLGDNFETSGLGKNLRLGWALCNGTTHSGVATPDLKGRMIMTYGGDFSTLNQIGGSKDAVIVDHNHNLNLQQLNSNSDGGYGKLATGGQPSEGTIPIIGTEQANGGQSGIGKNMPPYMTLVAIMKL